MHLRLRYVFVLTHRSPQKNRRAISFCKASMIKKFSKYLSDYFIKIGIVERKNKSWCQYVIEKKTIRLIFGMAMSYYNSGASAPFRTDTDYYQAVGG